MERLHEMDCELYILETIVMKVRVVRRQIVIGLDPTSCLVLCYNWQSRAGGWSLEWVTRYRPTEETESQDLHNHHHGRTAKEGGSRLLKAKIIRRSRR